MERAEQAGLSSIWALITGPEAKHWSRLLARDHLDPAAQFALFQTCRDGKELVLGAAKRVGLDLVLAMADPAPANDDRPALAKVSQARVQAARAAVLTRGKLHTTLLVRATTPQLLSLVQKELHGSTTWLNRLVLVGPTTECLPTTTLTTLARSCPNLRTLGVRAAVEALPSPHILPKLQALAVHILQPDNTEAILRSTAPYLTRRHLTALAILGPSAQPGVRRRQPVLQHTHIPLLFNPSHAPTHITVLTIDAMLDDGLLGTLLKCAPALQYLSVNDMVMLSDQHAQSKAAWRQLEVKAGMLLSSLTCLPLTAGLKLVLPESVVCDAGTPESAAAVTAAVARFSMVALRPGAQLVSVVAYKGMHRRDQRTALRAGLYLLRACRNPGTGRLEADLLGWAFSRLVIQELQGLPKWASISVRGIKWLPEGDVQYGPLLRLLPPSFQEVFVDCAGLNSTQIESICLGAPMERTAQAPLRIELARCEPALGEAIQHKVQLGHANVVVTVQEVRAGQATWWSVWWRSGQDRLG